MIPAAFCVLFYVADGFAPVAQQQQHNTVALSAMSKSIPFIKAPKGLEGYVGNEEFDPFGFAEIFDIKFLREAEIKHGRVSMLAIAGFVAPELGLKFPGAPAEIYGHPNPIKAATAVPPEAWFALILGAGIVEWVSNKGKMTYFDMFDDREPGDFSWDPYNFMKPGMEEEMKLKEITHCRAAMIGIGGMIHGAFVTGTGLFGATA
ncbi:hypothetical protein CTAYLR_008557 [Chrysophaeum taylorii]|uniref:Uncharacterized protein n=1 Tax=Chrysophaeum taylorii TaxID=2483200 RepID=A0AAD7U8X8_9STRA|nr:hypothetical protein CTAYLR_008557 [Chrysophaeum taylorii]